MLLLSLSQPTRLTGAFALVGWSLAVLLLTTGCQKAPPQPTGNYGALEPGLEYTNQHIPSAPWSVHVVRIERSAPQFQILSVHAENRALGLVPLSKILAGIPPAHGQAVAGINGDFYQRDKAYAGDPRGLQIIDHHFLSAPIGGVGFWIDASGEPHAGPVTNRFTVTLPDGSTLPFGLNEERRPDRAVIYTQLLGATTKTTGGRKFLLEPLTPPNWTGLPVETQFKARIRKVHEGGNAPIEPGTLVLSTGPVALQKLPKLEPGTQLTLSTTTSANLSGAPTAISGGPLLVRDGRALKIEPPRADSYEFSSMLERHPRSAIGWNKTHFYMVQVDGRQPGLSIGMTLEELGGYMANLGCEHALNLDGGGSATFWCKGSIRNSPCDGRERPIANALAIVRRPEGSNPRP